MSSFRTLQDVANAAGRLHVDPPVLPSDLYDQKLIPARALATLTARDTADKILHPGRKPTLNYDEWVPSIGADALAADMPYRNLFFTVPVPKSGGWRIASHVQGVLPAEWGVTVLSCGYHDYSASYDVDFLMRLGSLQLSLMWEARRPSKTMTFEPSSWWQERVRALGGDEPPAFVWEKEMRLGGVAARMLDSREYALRTNHVQLTESLARDTLSYYLEKARHVALGVDAENPEKSITFDRKYPRDTVGGYTFLEIMAPTEDEEALLVMKWNAKKRKAQAFRDETRANAELGTAFFRGKLREGSYRLPDTGMYASVTRPRARNKVPFIRFWRDRSDAIEE